MPAVYICVCGGGGGWLEAIIGQGPGRQTGGGVGILHALSLRGKRASERLADFRKIFFNYRMSSSVSQTSKIVLPGKPSLMPYVYCIVYMSSVNGRRTKNLQYIYRVPQCMSPRRNWDSPTPSHASECAPPRGTKGGVGTPACR